MFEFETFFICAQRIIREVEERWLFFKLFLIYNEINSQARAKRLKETDFESGNPGALLFTPTM